MSTKEQGLLLINETDLIEGFLNGIKSPKVTYLWSDFASNLIDGQQANGDFVERSLDRFLQSNTDVSNFNFENCIDWYWVYSNGYEEYSHTTCGASCDDNLEDACLDDGNNGGGGGDGLEDEDEEEIDIKELTNCHQELIKDLIGSSKQEFMRIFEKFNGNQPVPGNYNVKFQYGTCPPGATACTSRNLQDGWATITISQSVNQQATDLSFARTILHETLHAYLLFEEQYPSDCDLNCLLNDYIAKYGKNDLNDPHHNLFVETKFLNDIEIELKNYAISQNYIISTLGSDYFKDMAWGGLAETDVFKNSKTISEQNRINDRINAEINGESIVRPALDSEGNYTNVVTTPKALKVCD
ncbi:MAG: hypothetical protein ACXIUD_08840 [Mongoliitalea sp.]